MAQRRTRAMLVSIASGVVVLGGLAWLLRPAPPSPSRPAAPTGDSEAHEPAGGPDLTGGFLVTVAETNAAGMRELLLRSGNIVATLRLAEATDYAGDEASGRAILSATDRVAGARWVSALARWLGASVVVEPKAPEGHLPPLYGTYVRLPKTLGWEHYRLIFVHGSSRAEMLFDLADRADRGRLMETETDRRDGLITFLVAALRDGFARHVDVSAAPPIWHEFKPLPGENSALVHGWPAEDGAWGTINRGEQSTIVWWPRLTEAPVEVTKVDGLVTSLMPAPHGRKAAAVVVHPSRQYPPGAVGYAANDPAELIVVDTQRADPVRLVAAGDQLGFRPQLMWSPLGTSIAVEVKSSKSTQVRVVDISNQKDIATTSPATSHLLLEWTAQGLVFASGAEDGKLSFFRWLPAHGEPTQTGPQPERVSPDGLYSFRFVEGGLEVTGPKGVAPVPVVYSDLRDALEYVSTVRTWWLGGHRLLVNSDDLLSLDLETRQFRYLFPEERSLLLQGTSPDGSVVIARDETDHLVWARE